MKPPTPPALARLLAGVLIGGRSRRMGRPKATLDAAGMTLLERVLGAVGPFAGEVVLLGAGEVPASAAGLARLGDPPGLHGPVAGLVAAQRWAPDAAWLLLACDLPLLEPAALGWLLGERAPAHPAVMPRTADGCLQPLLAVYEPAAAPLVAAAAAAGRGPAAIAADPRVHCPRVPAALEGAFGDTDDPAALARARARLTERA